MDDLNDWTKLHDREMDYLKEHAICPKCNSKNWRLREGAYVEHCGGSPSTQVICNDCGMNWDANLE